MTATRRSWSFGLRTMLIPTTALLPLTKIVRPPVAGVLIALTIAVLTAVAAEPITTFNDPAFQEWAKKVAELPADKQVEAVAKKLVELNPGSKGVVSHKIEDGVVTQLTVYDSDGRNLFLGNLTDLSPVRALRGLKILFYAGRSPTKGNYWEVRGRLADLSPLKGMKLTTLICWNTQISDLSPLKGMPLSIVDCFNTNVADLSPLQGMMLTKLNCGRTQVTDLSPIKGMPLTWLWCDGLRLSDLSSLGGMPLITFDCSETQVADLSILRGMPLANLKCDHTPVSDLSPLKGVSLVKLICSNTQVADLSPLEGCKTLKLLDVRSTKVSRASAAALHNALPKCQIEWDDPDKPRGAQSADLDTE